MVGKLQPEFFPQVFGPEGNLPLDADIVRQKFTALATEIQAQTGDVPSPEQVAAGFLAIAVEKMANAIKRSPCSEATTWRITSSAALVELGDNMPA